jgi:hypothetical protein
VAFPKNAPAADPYFGTSTTGHDVLAVTQADGTYSLINLPPGQYQIEFSADGCGRDRLRRPVVAGLSQSGHGHGRHGRRGRGGHRH